MLDTHLDTFPAPSAAAPAHDPALPFADLVYAAALRQTRDLHAAADITQTVFLILSQKRAKRRAPPESRLAAWLLTVTAYAVKTWRRAQRRRAYHEQRVTANFRSAPMDPAEALSAEDQTRLLSLLDAALLRLPAGDREALVRRYLENQPIAAVAAALNLSENTAGRRIARALEKLRKLLKKRGLLVPAAGIAAVTASQSHIQAAPIALSTPAPHVAALAKATLGRMLMTKLLLASALATTALAASTTTYLLAAAHTAPAPAPLVLDNGQQLHSTLEVTRELQPPSDALKAQTLADLAAARAKIKTIYVESTVAADDFDTSTNLWHPSDTTTGRAWLQIDPASKSPPLARIEVTRHQAAPFVVPNGSNARNRLSDTAHAMNDTASTGQLSDESPFIEVWDGHETRRLYAQPSPPGSPVPYVQAQRADGPNLRAVDLSGRDFSFNAWAEESAADHTHGAYYTTFQYALGPAALSDPSVSVRRVQLSTGQTALEIATRLTPSGLEETDTCWLDPDKSLALIARRNEVSLNNQRLRRMTWQVTSLAQPSPGLYYPQSATLFWEQRTQPFTRTTYTATKITLNAPLPSNVSTLDFPDNLTPSTLHVPTTLPTSP